MSAPPPPLVFLVGFMATGKTTVGALVAAARGSRFVDLDDEIAARAGATPAAILAGRGEVELRRLEAEVLAAVIARAIASDSPTLVATGGGAACHGDNLDRMRAAGVVIALTAPLAVARARAASGATPRPLLSGADAEVAALYQRRIAHYRRAHARVETEGRAPAAVAASVGAALNALEAVAPAQRARTALLALDERSYPIVVADGALASLGALVRAALPPRCRRVAVVADGAIAASHGAAAAASLAGAGFTVAELAVAPGEPAKSIAGFHDLCERLVSAGLDRASAVIAVGGGVIGDLAGFAAATLYRGIACVQVPTTLLAMVDSAIGGKTGINLAAGKNLLGAFWQPRAVVADPALLATLPVRERRAAFGELVKYALLDGEALFGEIEALAPWAAAEHAGALPPPRTADVILRCASIKSWVVAGDEREQRGERALLNLGHTVGHAIEAAAGYGTVLHGEAVALGLLAACRVSAAVGSCGPELEARVADVIRRAGLSADLAPWLRPDVLDRIAVDKKRAGDHIDFIALRTVGDAYVAPLTLAEIGSFLRPPSAL